jgi:hypothetical protein
MKYLKYISITYVLAMLPNIALAANTTQQNLQQLDVTISKNLTPDVAFEAAASSLLDRLPFFLTVLAFGSLLYSGGMYVFAMGDPTKMENAKKNLTWTAYGMIAMSTILIVIKLVAKLSSLTTTVNDVRTLL